MFPPPNVTTCKFLHVLYFKCRHIDTKSVKEFSENSTNSVLCTPSAGQRNHIFCDYVYHKKNLGGKVHPPRNTPFRGTSVVRKNGCPGHPRRPPPPTSAGRGSRCRTTRRLPRRSAPKFPRVFNPTTEAIRTSETFSTPTAGSSPISRRTTEPRPRSPRRGSPLRTLPSEPSAAPVRGVERGGAHGR